MATDVRDAVDASATTTAPGGSVLPGDRLSGAQRLRLILVLGSLIAIGPLTIDMYLPALPAITADLLTTETAVQATITGTLIGLALGQLILGPLSDMFGRRLPLVSGLAIHVAASVLCVFSPNIMVLGAARMLQGLGVAAATVVALAVVRDLFSGVAFAKLLSRLLLVMGSAPILAPSLGSALLQWTRWQGVFVALAIMGAVLATVAFLALRETLPPERRRDPGVGTTVRAYGQLLRDPVFVGLIVVAGLAMGAVFAYVAGAPFVLQEQYGVSEAQFGVIFGVGAAGLVASTQLNPRLLRRYTPRQLVATALAGGSTAGFAMVITAATGFGGLPGLLAPLWLVLLAAGLVLPNAPALAMSDHGDGAGTAAAMLGAVQFGLGALTAPAVGALGGGATAMAMAITATMVTATGIMLAVIRRAPAPPQ